MRRDKPFPSRKGKAVEIGKCQKCGKISFPTKRDAKIFAKQHHPGEHMSQYRCSSFGGDVWHNGHPPRSIVTGKASWHVDYVHARDVSSAAKSVQRIVDSGSYTCDGCWSIVKPGIPHHCTAEYLDKEESGD